MLNHHASLFAVLLAAGVAFGCTTELVPIGAPPCFRFRLAPGQEMPVRTWKQCSGFEFSGQAGEVITIKVTGKTPGLDPNVRLYDPEGSEEAFDDDSGGNGNALIKEHLLLLSGTYTAIIGTDGNLDGEVTVLLEKLGDNELANPGMKDHDHLQPS